MCIRVLIFLEEIMSKIKKLICYFSRFELCLFGGSVVLIVAAFIAFDRENYLYLAASLVGAASLIFCAKGNPIGQLLMIVFSTLYGIISYTFSYYGEMITYLAMTLPMAVVALISWLKNPYKNNRAEVKVNRIKGQEVAFMLALSVLVTMVFYFVLKAFNTANLIPSTISVTTSFIAVYLTFRRSAYYALAYAANDVVLIVLWELASYEDVSYISVLVCFVMFLANDLYGFVSWKKREKTQKLL
ncbi:MAG: nicotinamide mononucleotide transporter [Oscillospiraceae bacterium]|nr:nicotinamide mononucleotide transporter [Oscillospiraceae bacterium]